MGKRKELVEEQPVQHEHARDEGSSDSDSDEVQPTHPFMLGLILPSELQTILTGTLGYENARCRIRMV